MKVIESTGDSCRDTHSMTPIHFTGKIGKGFDCECVCGEKRDRQSVGGGRGEGESDRDAERERAGGKDD